MGYAIVTLIGHNLAYDAKYGTDIFTGIEVPEGADRDIMVEEIFHRCGEFSVGHTDFEFMHEEILHFFKVHNRTFNKLFETLELEYNPLDNYDRQETWRDDGTYQNNNSGSENGQTTNSNDQETRNLRTDHSTSGSENSTTTHTSTGSSTSTTTYNSNTENKRAAFNSSDYEKYEKSTHGGTDSVTGSETSSGSDVLSGTDSRTGYDTTSGHIIDEGTGTHTLTTSGNNNGTDANVHTGRIHGNIGVTTSMALLKEQYEVVQLNAYKTIANLFADEYCIQVY